ncbi:LamG-like jellyroll fold domain-containing protein [Pseudoduganella namucuonensis]|uniref:Arabinan endo-1,5-alpha-L-arabinosidase n=1 Tax=Pseudoduganella namucuonensis TaxID=1035707 RepID=A0A1I7LNX6_9BURK|nr:family 43 glycosylhydrolase [Pseudoduganella namucuonensis]SFV11260.1 arabinan endo-1,5-alpha-L-arabinosidase [Pseudoduganella namucuonensis]
MTKSISLWRACAVLATSVLSTYAAAQAAYTPVAFQNASVHDPSVIKSGGTYYVFGSHLASAKSTDLMKWQQITDSVSATNSLFLNGASNVYTELAETFSWAQTTTLWAPDVIRLADGKYYMYYNACKGDSPRSALGVAVANNIEGPYVNKGVILKSGMWGQASYDGTVYDALKHPNTVDPNVFFDNGGRLWMTYGSYSGGIFIMQMNPTNGMPLPNQGYGKRLIGGNHARIEGAYVMYSPATQYYYLFTSFGGLDAAGGYNMRVARAASPDGPYYDAQGVNMANVKADPAKPLFDDASIAPYGVKIMGNFLFERRLGDAGTGIGTGYVSAGHNSAYYDAATGKHFLIFHSRFPERGEQHEIRVHQMFMNADGWPVVAPYRNTNETLAAVRREFVVGDYMYVNQGKDISATIKKSKLITLNSNGAITGAVSGTWTLAGANQVEINLPGSSPYKGVFLSQWDETSKSYVMTFSASSREGVAVIGSRLIPRTDAQVTTAIYNELSLGNTSAVTGNLTLPTTAARDAVVSWTSSNPSVLSNTGVVTSPASDTNVTLTATITKGSSTVVKTFAVTVRKIGGMLAHYAFDGNLADSTNTFGAGAVIGGKIDVAGGSLGYEAGMKGSAAVFNGATGVRLPNGLISTNTYTVAMWLKPAQLTAFTTTFFGARNGDAWISLLPKGHDFVGGATMLWSGTAWYDAGLGMNIPTGQWSHVAFTVKTGAVSVYVNGVKRFSGANFPNVFTTTGGVFALGVNWWDVPYKGSMDDLRIYGSALTDAEISSLAR